MSKMAYVVMSYETKSVLMSWMITSSVIKPSALNKSSFSDLTLDNRHALRFAVFKEW